MGFPISILAHNLIIIQNQVSAGINIDPPLNRSRCFSSKRNSPRPSIMYTTRVYSLGVEISRVNHHHRQIHQHDHGSCLLRESTRRDFNSCWFLFFTCVAMF